MPTQARPINFYLSTLRAPATATDTQFLLATGSTAALAAIPAGEFLFLTVSDGMSTEVVMYTSTGSIVNDTITVERAHDNTTAKAFPTGTCVAVGWNVAQVEFLIASFFTDSPPIPITPTANTVTIVGPNAEPSGEPAANIIYTVNITTGQLWYWNGSGWVTILSNGSQVIAGPPISAPIGGIIWSINSVASTLYHWDGAVWHLISADPGYLEVLGRQYIDPVTGVALTEGTDNVFSDMITATTITVVQDYYKSNPLVTSILSVNGTNELVFDEECLAQITATVFGEMASDATDLRGRLVLFHSASTSVFTSEVFHIAASGNTDIGVSVTTGPIRIAADDIWDCQLVLTDGGATYAGLQLHQFEVNASVIARTA